MDNAARHRDELSNNIEKEMDQKEYKRENESVSRKHKMDKDKRVDNKNIRGRVKMTRG